MKALLLHLEAIPAMTEGKKRKKEKTRQLQIGVEKPPVLSELCSLFICHGGPDSHECTAQQQAAKKKILRAQKDEDVGKSFASKHSGLDRQHFPLRRNVGKLGVVALTGKYWTDTFFKINTRNYCWPRLGCLGSPSNTTSARVRAVDGSQKK